MNHVPYVQRVVEGPNFTAEEQADQDRAMKWANETIPSWRNTYDLIRSIRLEERERLQAGDLDPALERPAAKPEQDKARED